MSDDLEKTIDKELLRSIIKSCTEAIEAFDDNDYQLAFAICREIIEDALNLRGTV